MVCFEHSDVRVGAHIRHNVVGRKIPVVSSPVAITVFADPDRFLVSAGAGTGFIILVDRRDPFEIIAAVPKIGSVDGSAVAL